VVEPVKKTSDGGYRVLGNVNFSDMLEYFELKDDDENAVPDTTIANWIMEKFGRLPRSGESLSWRHLSITITRVMRHRVMEVKVNTN